MACLTEQQQRAAAKKFADYWLDKGYEKGESQSFWLALLREVYGVEEPEKIIKFEEKVKIESSNFIDARIPQTQTLIEQKGRDKDLRKPTLQSDGKKLTPFQQAKRYSAELPYSQRPRRIVTCNFQEFLVYDMENPTAEPESILLKDLSKEFQRLQFLVKFEENSIQRETELSIRAGELVGVLYNSLLSRYINPTNTQSLQSLNILCVRLVFCLYAEDAGLFGKRQFSEYVKSLPEEFVRQGLIELFKVLNQRSEERDPYLGAKLSAFPYVGGLFFDTNIEIPQIDKETIKLLTQEAGDKFNWKEISPTIFGAVFESTLNPETRRQGGMHYTSIENIHKVIDPLFLDELRDELASIKELKESTVKNRALVAFQEKLGKLHFLDPACGSGNFLTETYISLRRLENEALRLLYPEKTLFKLDDPNKIICVSINQFFGIEINDFAATIAKTALWIAESQMLRETEDIFEVNLDFFPIKSYSNIVEGNALKLDWNDVVSKDELDYIIGNPPFIGYSLRTKEQSKEVFSIYIDVNGKPYKRAGKVDYVACWYYKACQIMQGTKIQAAFVSTNSIVQGEQVSCVWKPLTERFDVKIDFAYRSFRWDNEANQKAQVYCVIIGFSCFEHNKPKRIFSEDFIESAENINAYLLNAPDVFIENRFDVLSCNVPELCRGSQAIDNGNFFLEESEKAEVLSKEPELLPYIKQCYGADEYINNKKRYCFWLVGASPSVIHNSPILSERIKRVREYRANSQREATRKSVDSSVLFSNNHQPTTPYIIIPRHFSRTRQYVPLGFVSSEIIATDSAMIIPDATLYHFGVLISSVHFTWMRFVCGYLGTGYCYSMGIVYNNFPWAEPSQEQRACIEATAQGILDARSLFPNDSLASLYDELSMPIEIRKAHWENDRAVLKAYGFLEKEPSEKEIVAELTRRYERLVREK